MKTKIFIGSSSESAYLIDVVKQKLEPEYECVSWDKYFFEMNQSTFDTLVKKTISFDYAIFIGGKDDKVVRLKNGKKKYAPRDNLYLELGLYAGALTKHRTFFFIDKSTQVASDLMGITLLFYACEEDVLNGCDQIKKKIQEEEKISRVGFLPSTSLAIGYYENFLRQVGEALFDIKSIKIEGEEYNVQLNKKKVYVVIPENVEEDWQSWAKEFYSSNCYLKAEIIGELRSLNVMIDYNAFNTKKELRIYDVPQTMRSAFYAVDMVIKDGEGKTEFLTEVKWKEVDNFIKTLENLMNKNVQVKKRTEIKIVNSI